MTRPRPAWPASLVAAAAMGLFPSPALAQSGSFLAAIADIAWSLGNLVSWVAWLLAIIFAWIGLTGLVRSANEPRRGYAGPLLWCAAGFVMFSAQSWIDGLAIAFFGSADQPALMLQDGISGAQAVINMIIPVAWVVGAIAVARGIGLLPAISGGRVTATQVSCHLLGGVLACNLGPLMRAIQASFGLSVFR